MTLPRVRRTPQLRPASPWLLRTQACLPVTNSAAGSDPDSSGAARPGAPNATIRWGRPMLQHAGYPTALRWGYHGVRLPRAAHKAHPSPGRRRRTQVRLASPAERWGGFGTCVQNKTTGETKPSATTDQGPTTRLQHYYRLNGPCPHAGPVY